MSKSININEVEAFLAKIMIARESLLDIVSYCKDSELPDQHKKFQNVIGETVYLMGETIELLMVVYPSLRDTYQSKLNVFASTPKVT